MSHSSYPVIGLYSRHLQALEPTFLDAIVTTIQNAGGSIIACETIDDYPAFEKTSLKTMADRCDLILSIGGDGTLLDVAQAAIGRSVAVLGIHKGTIGFLTDLTAQNLNQALPRSYVAGEKSNRDAF